MIVLEHIPAELAARITRALAVPTIGVGAGPECDPQVLVVNDAIGLGDRWPPFSRQYAYASRLITKAAETFARQVRERSY
jgi:3-methyl-2-oxobutanoate hydroxymethyltransferase